jgi:predicted RNA-binding protein with RPS1 domain
MPLHEGQIVTGRVIEFVGSGAKIALSPRLFAHLSAKNLSWKRKYGQEAKDYFDLDNEVLVRILEIKNREDKKPHIQVGFRETEPDPWAQAVQLHPPQSKARGVVCFHLPFGVMVELPTGFEAFVHETEVSWDRKTKAKDFPKIGLGVDLIIQEVDPAERKISGSIKSALTNPYSDLATSVQPLETTTGIVKSRIDYGFFVRLNTGAVGLIHKSRLPERLKEAFCVGDEIHVRILAVDSTANRVTLELDLERYYSDWSGETEKIFPAGKIPEPAKFSEGASRVVTVNYYERNPAARRTCIEYHGVSCAVCGFSFAQAFGSLGDGFIHVHHLNPVSEQDGEYTLDPVRDMRPVCPNCHAMIHKRRPPYSIEELRAVLSNNLSAGKSVRPKSQLGIAPLTT